MSDTGHTALVRVKPLEWHEVLSSVQHAYTPFGLFYSIDKIDEGFVLCKHEGSSGKTKSYWPSEDEAKAAAQADYERRILSAIEPSPSLPILVEALESARETIRGLVTSRSSEAEGSPDDWTADIDAALASIKGGQ